MTAADRAEHRAGMARIAFQRMAEGKPVWDRKIRLGGVFRNPEMTFTERRDAIVRVLRESAWFKGYGEFDDLPQFVEELSEAETPAGFDGVWDEIYDIADADRVWIDTRGIA